MRNRPAAILCLTMAFFFCLNTVEVLASQQSSVAGEIAKDKAYDEDANRKEKKTAASSSGTNAPSVEERLKALEEIIERQQREIQALRGLVEKRNSEKADIGAAETVSPEPARVAAEQIALAGERVESTSKGDVSLQTDETQKKVEELYKKFGSLRVSGDIRFRAETFSNQGFDSFLESPTRTRLRIRARLALDGSINENFDWGLKFATGIFTDPISSNQTLTDFYERKPVALERAFIRFDSRTDGAGVQLVAGKFEPTFRRTQMVWDDDLNVEGISEALYFKTDSSLKQIKLVAFQLPFNESSGGKDGVLYGGQIQSDWNLSSTVSARVDAAYYDWVRADAVIDGLGASSTQVNGGLSNGAGLTGGQNGSLGTTNRLRRNASGDVIGFLANFHLFDILSNVTWQATSRIPISFTFDYVRNLSDRINDEQNGYWVEVKVGDTKKRGDWMLGYGFTRIEQDAVLVPFNFSDILASNSRAHMPSAGYQIRDGVTFQWTGLFSQRANRVVLLSPFNRYLNRMQFDVIYKF